MQYKFKEGEENKPANERVIEKTGLVVEFSMLQMEHDILSFEKTLKELKGNRDLKQSVMDNVNIHHPEIKDIPEFDRHAIHMYQEAFSMVKAFNTKIDQIQKEYDEYLEEIAEVKSQIPELAPIESPYIAQPESSKVDEPNAVDEPKEDEQEQ